MGIEQFKTQNKSIIYKLIKSQYKKVQFHHQYIDLYQILNSIVIKKLKTTLLQTNYYYYQKRKNNLIPMLNKNIYRTSQCLHMLQYNKPTLLISNVMFINTKKNSLVHDCTQKSIVNKELTFSHLHFAKLNNLKSTQHKLWQLFSNPRFTYSTKQVQTQPDYNNFTLVRQLHSISQSANKFHASPNPCTFLSQQYPTITLDLQRKLQKIQSLLNSQQRNIYKIVEETIIVLESFAQTMRRDVMEENVIKVIREFSTKIVSAYLENVQSEELEENERRKSQRIGNNDVQTVMEENDSSYLLHDNYTAPLADLEDKDFRELSGSCNNIIDASFIFFYLETLKTWLLTRLETDTLIQAAEKQMHSFFDVRELSALQDRLKSTLDLFLRNYIDEPSVSKRQLFPFDMKLRGLCLLPYFENKQQVERYLKRLADENLFIYLKESQMLTLLWDVTQIQPDLTDLTHFVYQIQSTRVYQNLASMKAAYIKALFINYSRKFMVSYQQIQFYELFRDIEPRIKYPTIRTFIRLIHVLKTEAADLHCEYNKVMNKYNYNIIISIIASQSYTIENTKFDELFQLFEALNSLEKSGEILYDQLCKFLRQYAARENEVLKENQLQRVYNVFLHVVEQVKPLYKYEQKQGLNKEFSKKTTILLNTLFDILLEKYPHIVFVGSKFVKNYLISDDSAGTPTFMALPNDDREINIDITNSTLVETKMFKISNAFKKVVESSRKLSLKDSTINEMSVTELLDTMLLFMKINVHVIKGESESANSNPVSKLPEDLKLLYHLYPKTAQNIDEQIFNNILKPLLEELTDVLSKKSISQQKFSINQFKMIYTNLYKLLDCVNSLQFGAKIATQVHQFVQMIRKNLIEEIKIRIQQREKEEEKKRVQNMQTLKMVTPKNNIEILLCLSELSKLSSKINLQVKSSKEHHLSSSTITPTSSILLPDLPLIYKYINTIAIQNMKSIQEPYLIPMLLFIKSLEEIKSSQSEKILLLELNHLVHEYLYSSMSMFVMYLGDRGKYFLKLSNNNADDLMSVINHFVASKTFFKALQTKKRLVVLQAFLIGLIRKKYLKITSTHLKRSQHAKIFLTFLQIFEYPQNLILDMKKMLEQVEFLSSDLEEFSTEILERYSDLNWSIARYLEENKVGLTSSKKLARLSTEDLRKQFEQGRSPKIYEMILKNSRYQLPFELPQPKQGDENTKLVYIVQKIYQKISKNYYGVQKASPKSSSYVQTPFKKKSKRFTPMMKDQVNQQPFQKEDQNERDDEIFLQKSNYESNNSGVFQKFKEINLESEKSYIKSESLVNYIYEDHYKMSENKLPLHFKKQTWKSLLSLPKELEIESLQIDQKIDQNIYKQILLALLGYVEKVKMIAKEFHSHSFIQYVAAQLDMEVYFHGCIAKISRKNKPEENVLFVCALQSNYKLLYICTHILRESGENAFIISDKTKEIDFKDFLEKLLPQPFSMDDLDIVDKVVKDEISIDAEDSGIIREEL